MGPARQEKDVTIPQGSCSILTLKKKLLHTFEAPNRTSARMWTMEAASYCQLLGEWLTSSEVFSWSIRNKCCAKLCRAPSSATLSCWWSKHGKMSNKIINTKGHNLIFSQIIHGFVRRMNKKHIIVVHTRKLKVCIRLTSYTVVQFTGKSRFHLSRGLDLPYHMFLCALLSWE